MTIWNRDLPVLEKIKEKQQEQRIHDYASRILADHDARMIEHRKIVAAAYAKRDAEIAAIRSRRNQIK